MGFFSVAVFMTDKNQSVDELLAPYDEELCVEQFLYRTKAEIIEQEREKLQWDFKHEYRDWQKDPKAYEKEHNDPSYIQYLKSIPERMKWTDEQIYQDAIKGLEDDLNENGDQMSYRNPNTRFDHQETGGRFKGVLIRKGAGPESEGCYEAFIREIDFEAMHQRALAELMPYKKALRACDYKSYMHVLYPNEEEYISRAPAFSTDAVVTPDGKWHDPGDAGYLSATPEEEREWYIGYYERFIKPALDKNLYLVIVDCHR